MGRGCPAQLSSLTLTVSCRSALKLKESPLSEEVGRPEDSLLEYYVEVKTWNHFKMRGLGFDRLTVKLQFQQVLSYHFSLWGPNSFLFQEIPQLGELVRGNFAFQLPAWPVSVDVYLYKHIHTLSEGWILGFGVCCVSSQAVKRHAGNLNAYY